MTEITKGGFSIVYICQKIDKMDLKTLLKNNARVIDVRETWEFNEGHAPDSLNIPLGSIPGKLKELEDMERPLILVCASGNRSGQAMAWLQSQGLDEVYNGGSWQAVAQAV